MAQVSLFSHTLVLEVNSSAPKTTLECNLSSIFPFINLVNFGDTLKKWQSQWMDLFLTQEGKENLLIHSSEEKGTKINKTQSTRPAPCRDAEGSLRLGVQELVRVFTRTQLHKCQRLS